MIEVRNLTVDLEGFHLGPIDLEIEKGEFFIIVGPTGAGKTILLETIAGIYNINTGKIIVDGKDITQYPPEKRNIGIVYQDFSLFPHLNVIKNIEYGLKTKGVSSEKRKKTIEKLSNLLCLNSLLNRSPETLSGGEKQRVALARALAIEPLLILLDEPLSALDPNIREKTAKELKSVNKKTKTTFLMVTHNIKEALSIADRIAIMRDGKIEQVGNYKQLIKNPASTFVAEFFGVKNLFLLISNRMSQFLNLVLG